jgi:two-component system, chemotaxis family, sensor kinase CheA
MQLIFDLQPGDDRLFTDESLEQIERIEQGLLTLEHGLDSAVVNEVFRAAHTLKGSAATIGHRRMAELTHAMEDLFGGFRSGTLTEMGPFANTLLSTIDVLRALVAEVGEGETLTDSPEALTGQIRALLSSATAAAATGSSTGPAAGPVGASGPVPADADGVANVAVAPLIGSLLAENHPPEPCTIVICRVDPMSEWQAVRLLQLVMEAEESDRLVNSIPKRPEIESGRPVSILAMLLRGMPSDLVDLRRRLAMVDDVVSVEAVAAPISPEIEALLPIATRRQGEEGDPGAAVRRGVDLGVEARGLNEGERLALAGDRLKAAQQTIRIDVSRLDELMNLVGELVVYKTRLQQSATELALKLGDDPIARQAEADSQMFARISGQLQDQVTGLRMLPIETVFNRFPRVVRDVSAKLDKRVQLVIEGKETELDRSVLDEVGDPLGHLIRNALDHGIEPPSERIAAGKDPMGTVRMTARHSDGRILITVEDDGRGMDPATLRKAVIGKGLMTREAAESATDNDMLRVVFMPGFSTAATVTEVSGRGVGMDVVRSNIERLGGWVDISSAPGKGTRVALSLPLTLAILGALLVKSGERTCALPLTGVVETQKVHAADLGRVRGQNVWCWRERVIPVLQLDQALGDPTRPFVAGEAGDVNLVVVRSRGTEMALIVDGFVGQHEIVLKSLSAIAGSRKGLAGATVMADGTVGLVVDISALLDSAAERVHRDRAIAPARKVA